MRSLGGTTSTTVTVKDGAREGRLTALLLVDGESFEPLAEYFRERNVSLSSEQRYAHSVALLLDFMGARGREFAALEKRRELFNAFGHAVRYGTVREGNDPSGLWWVTRRMETVKGLMTAAAEFSDWLVERHDAKPLNPWRSASCAERIVFWRKWNTTRAASMLRHIKDPGRVTTDASRARRHGFPESVPAVTDRPPYFPPERFDELLTRGFARPGKQKAVLPWVSYTIRDMLIAILMYAGGLRVSEAFHLFVGDVFQDPGDPTLTHVRVYHPVDGEIEYRHPVTGNTVRTNRAAYLQIVYQRRPLTWADESGWKGAMLQRGGLYRQVFWFPQDYARVFMALYRMYLEHVRPVTVKHPWLFVTEVGEPMTPDAYKKRFATAVRRIGLRPCKAEGTTPHGLRHAYGQRLQDAVDAGQISRKEFQTAMAHRSILSQESYNEREAHKVQLALATVSLANPATELLEEFAA